jgi:hypothetical protein
MAPKASPASNSSTADPNSHLFYGVLKNAEQWLFGSRYSSNRVYLEIIEKLVLVLGNPTAASTGHALPEKGRKGRRLDQLIYKPPWTDTQARTPRT